MGLFYYNSNWHFGKSGDKSGFSNVIQESTLSHSGAGGTQTKGLGFGVWGLGSRFKSLGFRV